MKLGSGKPLTIELLKSKCHIDAMTGCWNFIGDKAQVYPRINFGGRLVRASHAALIIKLGRGLKPGLCALHSCDNTKCANPDHLCEGTHGENRLDAMAKGRFSGWSLSESTKAKMSIARLGTKVSDATKAKLKEYWRSRREAT